MNDADLILVGGGLANGLIALRLKEAQPELSLLVLEQAEQPAAITPGLSMKAT